jgi:CheY-like chemotaxis protein
MLATLLAPPPAPRAMPAPEPLSMPSRGQRELHVLIVEDNPVNQQLVQKILTNQGCRWTSVTNGRAALEQLTRSAPNIVLMDLHMPELDGLSAITRIRAGDAGAALRDVWIIALTADARSEQRQRTLAAGANDYLTKPVQVPELKAAIARYVQSSV